MSLEKPGRAGESGRQTGRLPRRLPRLSMASGTRRAQKPVNGELKPLGFEGRLYLHEVFGPLGRRSRGRRERDLGGWWKWNGLGLANRRRRRRTPGATRGRGARWMGSAAEIGLFGYTRAGSP